MYLMSLSFDLISDLHVETWDHFDWSGQATSPIAIVAGDVARDTETACQVLDHLSECYQGVFYIDGNDEHKHNTSSLLECGSELREMVSLIPGVVSLYDNVAMIDGVAVIGANGWWDYELDPELDTEQSRQWYQQHSHRNNEDLNLINVMCYQDARYLAASVEKLQLWKEVKEIVIVTHTVPHIDLLRHDPNLQDTWRLNCMGSNVLRTCLEVDTEHKISTWCFGHYHGDVDRVIDGVRYVNNCRGRGDTPWGKQVYFPKRIQL